MVTSGGTGAYTHLSNSLKDIQPTCGEGETAAAVADDSGSDPSLLVKVCHRA